MKRWLQLISVMSFLSLGCRGLQQQEELYQDNSSTACSTCDNRKKGFERCKQEKKIVDASGLCGCPCSGRFCGHQIGHADGSCSMISAPPVRDNRGGVCGASTSGNGATLKTLQYATPAENDKSSCFCNNVTQEIEAVRDMEDSVIITAYPWKCDCALANNSYVSTLDIRLRYTGWEALGIILEPTMFDDPAICREFQLKELNETVLRSLDSPWLQWDCPALNNYVEGTVVTVHICGSHARLTYKLRLPRRSALGATNLSTWEPLIKFHVHRSDKLAFSVQRARPDSCTRTFTTELMLCDNETCKSPRPVQDTKRIMQVDCAESEWNTTTFRVTYDLPPSAGIFALSVKPDGGKEILSVTIQHGGTNATVVTAVTICSLLIFLVLVVAVVWVKYFYQPPELKWVDVLVVYNSETNLVRRLVNALEKHCQIITSLDVVSIPHSRHNMDPSAWLVSEMDRCSRVLVLWFPDTDTPPVYSLFHQAIKLLAPHCKDKQVVVATRPGSVSPLPPELRAYQPLRLPTQLPRLVAQCRSRPGWLACRLPAACCTTSPLASRLLDSPEGRQLVALLAGGPGAAAPLVSELELQLEPARNGQPPLLPAPPRLHAEQMDQHVPPLERVLADEPPARPPTRQHDLDDILDVQWHE